MERLDAYIRVSRVGKREGPSYISPSVQREQIQRWAAYKGVEIAEWFTDEDWSGGAASRPGLDAAVARAISGETGGIVSAKIDRFSRLTEQGVRDLRRLQDTGARLAFVLEDIDASGPMGKFVYVIMLAQAELFLDQIKAGWITAKARAVDRGAKIGPTPLGYQRTDDGTMIPSNDAERISEAYRLAASGNLGHAGRYLAEQFPDRRWESSKVRRLLANRAYLGEARYGDMLNVDAHDPLVSRAVWEAAQTAPAARKTSEAFPLTGLLECGTCGSPMSGGRGGKGQRTYRCSATMTTSRGTCERGATITADLIERYVREEARDAIGSVTVEVGSPEQDALTLLERAILDAEAELDAFAGDLRARRALGARYHDHLEARSEAVECAQAAYREHARKAQPVLTEDALGSDAALVFALRRIFKAIVVVPGRGMRVGDRVRWVPHNPDGAAGIDPPVVGD